MPLNLFETIWSKDDRKGYNISNMSRQPFAYKDKVQWILSLSCWNQFFTSRLKWQEFYSLHSIIKEARSNWDPFEAKGRRKIEQKSIFGGPKYNASNLPGLRVLRSNTIKLGVKT